jgi:bifunctional DNase/RNase
VPVPSPEILSIRTTITVHGMTQVRCEVKGVFVAMGETTTVPLVVLSDGSDRMLPVFIGIWEAVSINSAKNKEVLPRPFTHDLFIDLCGKFSITFRFLQIDSLEEGVYYAQLVLHNGQREEYLDCRPSDGIALALRGEIPIFVDESVLAAAGQRTEDFPEMVDLATFMQKRG